MVHAAILHTDQMLGRTVDSVQQEESVERDLGHLKLVQDGAVREFLTVAAFLYS